MRFVVYGVGAIGGTIAASLALARKEIVGIARGSQLDAIRRDGLLLRSHRGEERARFECFASPADMRFRPDDVILLTMKTQDSAAALAQLAAAGVSDQPIFCVQNGVENERLALRRFQNVHAVTVMMPVDFMKPGEISAFGAPKLGVFDIGRYPSGSDRVDAEAARELTEAGFPSFVTSDVMASKYGKLLVNLNNIVEAALGKEADTKAIRKKLRAEGEAVLKAAGIEWREVGSDDPRRKEMSRIEPIPGMAREGSSSTQSLARGTGSIETDYLNGEIVLLGRLHAVPTPGNSWFLRIAARMVREKLPVGTIPLAEAKAALDL